MSFNYNQTLRNINLDDYSDTSSSSDCESSAFRYEPHGHVNSITGDLRIVQDRKVRCLLKKGPKLGNRIPSTGTLIKEY